MILALVTFSVCMVLGWIGTRVVRFGAIRIGLWDRPNARSSHMIPTPRGGGIAIVATVLAAIVATASGGLLSISVSLGLGLGMTCVAAIGLLDDTGKLRGSGVLLRAAIHLASAAWAVWCLGGLQTLRVGETVFVLGMPGSVAAVLAIAWSTNMYNFMDGIDGIAAGHAVMSATIAGLVLLLAGSSGLGLIALATAGASLGFLMLNWNPARIFMGDVGSGALGFVFGALALASENSGGLPAVSWLLLMGVFVFDATVTLLRRLIRGERVYEAHRAHAYQRLVGSGMSHARVATLAIVACGVLGTLAVIGWWYPSLWMNSIVVGFILLLGMYVFAERVAPMTRPRLADRNGTT